MRTVRLSRKEFKERFGEAEAQTERYQGTESVVYLPGRASTKEMLHEIYHAVESPDLERIEEGGKWSTLDELILEELRAQRFASKKMGRGGDLPWSMVLGVADTGLHWGYSPAAIMGAIKRAAKEEGLASLDSEQRRDLWDYLRGFE